MKHTGKLAAGLLAIAMTASMADCGGSNISSAAPASSISASSAAEAAKPFTGGGSRIMYIITPSHSSPFFKTEAESASTKTKGLDYEVKVVSHDDDVTKQTELFDSAIADKAAAVICDNTGVDATVATVKRARDNNIPTFLIDHEINKSGMAISQIVANNYQDARVIAEKFVETMGEKGEYAELLGKESDTSADVCSSAFHEVIDQCPDMKMVAQQAASQEQTETYQKVETILQSNPNVKSIICGNDTMAVGAAMAIKATGLKDIVIVGVDRSDEAAEQIKSGNMVGTALRQVALIAEMGAEQADRYLKAGSTGKDERQLVDRIATTKDNVNRLKNFVYSG